MGRALKCESMKISDKDVEIYEKHCDALNNHFWSPSKSGIFGHIWEALSMLIYEMEHLQMTLQLSSKMN